MTALTVSVDSFLVEFEEFKSTDRITIERKLKMAERFTPESVWGDDRRYGIMLLAAHYIAMSPIGEPTRLEADEKQTTYGVERKELEGMVSLRVNRVI